MLFLWAIPHSGYPSLPPTPLSWGHTGWNRAGEGALLRWLLRQEVLRPASCLEYVPHKLIHIIYHINNSSASWRGVHSDDVRACLQNSMSVSQSQGLRSIAELTNAWAIVSGNLATLPYQKPGSSGSSSHGGRTADVGLIIEALKLAISALQVRAQ